MVVKTGDMHLFNGLLVPESPSTPTESGPIALLGDRVSP
jgi:hypothetical protein